MAKVIINGAQFRPFTMDELLKPLALATEEHHRIEDQQNAMAEEAAMWEWLLPQTGEARNAYNTWNENLRAQVDALNANGLSPQVRQQMTSLRRTSPIKALTYANEQLQKEMQIRAQRGDNAVYEKPNLTIDDFWRGATPNNNYRDLSQITQQTSNAVQAYARTIQSSPNFQKAIGSNGQYFDISQTQGVPYAVIQAAFDPNYTPANDQERDALNQIRNIVNSQRGDRFSQYDAAGQSKIDNAIYQGLLTGSEVTTHQLQQDRSLERAATRQSMQQSAALFNQQYDIVEETVNGRTIQRAVERPEYTLRQWNLKGYDALRDANNNIVTDVNGNMIPVKIQPTNQNPTNTGNQRGRYYNGYYSHKRGSNPVTGRLSASNELDLGPTNPRGFMELSDEHKDEVLRLLGLSLPAGESYESVYRANKDLINNHTLLEYDREKDGTGAHNQIIVIGNYGNNYGTQQQSGQPQSQGNPNLTMPEE